MYIFYMATCMVLFCCFTFGSIIPCIKKKLKISLCASRNKENTKKNKKSYNNYCCQIGGTTTSITERWEVAPYLHHLDYKGWALGSLPGWPKIGIRRKSGPLAPYQAGRSPHPGPRAGENISRADLAVFAAFPDLIVHSHTVSVILCHPCTTLLLTHELYTLNKT